MTAGRPRNRAPSGLRTRYGQPVSGSAGATGARLRCNTPATPPPVAPRHRRTAFTVFAPPPVGPDVAPARVCPSRCETDVRTETEREIMVGGRGRRDGRE